MNENELRVRFGAFAPMFVKGRAGVPRYLELLGLHVVVRQSRPSDAVEVARDAVQSSQHLEDELVALFSDVNWRPHLVGILGLAISGAKGRPVNSLWAAFDAGSWVTPQLAAGASVVDAKFQSEARARVEAARRYDARPYANNLAEAARLHSARGPEGNQERDAKCLQSLLALLSELPEQQDWVADQRKTERVQSVLSASRQDFGPLAGAWATALRAVVG
jgi:hypothetical protein